MKALILITALIVLGACGSGQHPDSPNGSGTGPAPRDPTPSPAPGGGNPYGWTSGATADFVAPDVRVLEQYAGRPLNFPVGSPVQMKINLEMFNTATDGREIYGGLLRIAYQEPNPSGGPKFYREAVFDAGSSLFEARYNEWKMVGGKAVFRAFLEDRYGSVIIVIDSADDLGQMSGSIYFHNFKSTYAAKPPPPNGRCWLIKIGPYDCRDFLVGSGDDDDKNVDTSVSIYPYRIKDGERWYTKLGTFTGMDGHKAFNN